MSDSTAKPIKVSARLDAERSRKLDVLARSTDQGVSEVIKAALDLYYDHVRAGRRPVELLRATGFIASGEAAADLSENFKDELARSLADKHDPR